MSTMTLVARVSSAGAVIDGRKTVVVVATAATGPGGVARLDALADVDVDEGVLVGGEALVWDVAGAWVPGTPTGGGGGSALSVQENDVELDAAVNALDFNGTDFDLTESPDHEINIALSADVARDADVTAEAATRASGDATNASALAAHLADTSDAHDASAVSVVPAGSIASTDVQAALTELDSEKAASSHAHAGEDITSGTVADARIASTIARDTEVAAAVTAHEAASDPHTQYLTAAEGTAAYDALGAASAAIVSATAAEFIRDTIGTALTAGAHISVTVSDPGDTITIAVTGLTTSDLSDFATATDERARDALGAALTAGAGITITPNDGADTITVASTITQYTDENARDALGTALTAGANITITPNDGADTITIAVSGLTSASLSDFTEAVQDVVGAYVVGGTGITATYSDVGNTLTFAIDTSAENERIDDRVAALLVAGANITLTYNDGANTLTLAVTGLTTADLSDFATATDERARDAVAAALGSVDGTIAIAVNDGANTIDLSAAGTSMLHIWGRQNLV